MVGGVKFVSCDALTPFGLARSISLSEKRPSDTTGALALFPPWGLGGTTVSVSVLVLLYAVLFTSRFAPAFTSRFASVFASIFEAKHGIISEVKPSGNTHSPSIFSGKQYVGASLRLDPFRNAIKPFIASLSLPAANVFSVTAISATARGLERENGFFHPSRLLTSSNLK